MIGFWACNGVSYRLFLLSASSFLRPHAHCTDASDCSHYSSRFGFSLHYFWSTLFSYPRASHQARSLLFSWAVNFFQLGDKPHSHTCSKRSARRQVCRPIRLVIEETGVGDVLSSVSRGPDSGRLTPFST